MKRGELRQKAIKFCGERKTVIKANLICDIMVDFVEYVQAENKPEVDILNEQTDGLIDKSLQSSSSDDIDCSAYGKSKVIDWNKLSIKEHIAYLERKFAFDSSAVSKSIHEVIQAYMALLLAKENKGLAVGGVTIYNLAIAVRECKTSQEAENVLREFFNNYQDNPSDDRDLVDFVRIFNHEYRGKDWTVSNFITALDNWYKPKK